MFRLFLMERPTYIVKRSSCVEFYGPPSVESSSAGFTFANSQPSGSISTWESGSTTPSIENTLSILRQSDGRSEIADCVAHLLDICEHDDESAVEVESLWSLASFFLAIPIPQDVPTMSVSPDGFFVAEWIGSDEAMAMEFVGQDEILLVLVIVNQAESRKVTFEEAEPYLIRRSPTKTI